MRTVTYLCALALSLQAQTETKELPDARTITQYNKVLKTLDITNLGKVGCSSLTSEEKERINRSARICIGETQYEGTPERVTLRYLRNGTVTQVNMQIEPTQQPTNGLPIFKRADELISDGEQITVVHIDRKGAASAYAYDKTVQRKEYNAASAMQNAIIEATDILYNAAAKK
jgi:hypothetical protein